MYLFLDIYKAVILALNFAGDIIPGRKQSFSSYPGSMTSGDDFYMLSSGMVSSTKDITFLILLMYCCDS